MRRALLLAAPNVDDPAFGRLHLEEQVAKLASLLADPEVCAFDVTSLVDPTTSEATRVVERTFSAASSKDLILFYFAGHGLKDDQGQLFFALRDTELPLLRSTALAADFVSKQMDLSRAGQVVVLLDCAYSGAFIRELR
jgi:uncharacterized caspase-like protein